MGFLQRIVKNDATKSDPPEIYNVRVFLVSLVACAGALLFGMDMGIMGGVLTMKTFKQQYGLIGKSDKQIANLSSNIVSVIQAGAFAGALVASWLSNRIGRRWSLIIAAILVCIGVAFQAAANGIIELLYASRLFAGIAVGIASTVNPLYVSENAPRGIRGLLTGLYQLTLVSGLTLAFWINYGSNLHITGHAQYVIPLALQAFPAVILGVGMFFANESPRYLAQRNPAAALAVLSKLRHLPPTHPYVVDEMALIELQLEEERALMAGSSALSMFKEAWTVKSYRRRSILCVTLMMWSNLTGTNAMTYYSPTIFASVGLSGSSVGLFATGIYGIVKMISCAIFIFFVTDTLGRRKSLIWTGIVQGCALFYCGFYIRFDPPIKGQPVTAPGYVALVAIYIFAAVYQFGWGPVVWTYCSECPPARLRALMMGMAVASQWLWNFVVAKSTPSMFATLGKGGFGTYFVYGSFCFVMVIYAWVLVPETKGLSLEHMDELFEQKNIRAKFVPSRGVAMNGHGNLGKGDDDDKEPSEHIEKV
ncbi:general substrate transporter [Aaosphaeria arxii CBS 175.79]|uniref:General substrate transporter n=1 Tax=Aaosphaeria arxii CBS 175.79 TaxID=1450172 RepID=A0A6A5Y8Y9_9PLEO|nr:general substrate transporter [Aaosphaeria arxii CBS 175.79]KAF2021477.1 general substrate transporter [Aaosphaeria arxii CBS 175.79]